MKKQVVPIALGFSIVLLISLTWLIAGCGEERSPLAPEQELFMAPSNGNSGGNPSPNGNAVGNPHSDAEPDLNGEANGNPHINYDTDADPEPNGHAVGNPHLDEDDKTRPNGEATGNPHLPETDGDSETTPRGAVKMVLQPLMAVDGESVGWVLVNTTVDVDGETVNGILITRIHLKTDEAEETFNVTIFIDQDGAGIIDFTIPVGEITTNIKGNGSAKFEIDLDTLDGFIDNADVIYVKVLIKESATIRYYTGYATVPIKRCDNNN